LGFGFPCFADGVDVFGDACVLLYKILNQLLHHMGLLFSDECLASLPFSVQLGFEEPED
jgi:hypothetical protein